MVTFEQIQQNDSILDLVEKSSDGYMFCVDLQHEEGREACEVLRNAYPDVAEALRAVEKASINARYMLALVPKEGRVPSWFSHEARLPIAIQMLHNTSTEYGGMWLLAVIPVDQQIIDMFGKLSSTAGSA